MGLNAIKEGKQQQRTDDNLSNITAIGYDKLATIAVLAENRGAIAGSSNNSSFTDKSQI